MQAPAMPVRWWERQLRPPSVAGKLWVDKQDFGWIKVDGQVAQSFSMGLFVARVERGSHIILEQTCVGDGVSKRLELRATPKSL
jgi:hypothetical protein